MCALCERPGTVQVGIKQYRCYRIIIFPAAVYFKYGYLLLILAVYNRINFVVAANGTVLGSETILVIQEE